MSDSTNGLQRVARSEHVTALKFLPVQAHGRTLLLGRLRDGTPFAFGRICPHQHKPLDEGTIWGNEIDCPHHHYTYDPLTGRNLFPSRMYPEFRVRCIRGIPVYKVKEEQGWIWIGPQKPPPEGVELDE